MELLEKVWPEWKVEGELGEGSFGKVYRIKRQDIGGTYHAALKVITIPKDKSELSSIMTEGMMDKDSVTHYFRGMMEEIVKEFAMMEKLKGNTNIVAYEDHRVIPHEEGPGWDILIRMELLTPLTDYMAEHSLGEMDAIKIGIDICRALELCQKYNIIHRDIKPENIFVSELGDYKLGDFGVARTAEKTMSGMSKKGTYTYMAPEVYKGKAYNATVDLYSLGIVLYRLVNNYRTPFLPPAPQMISFNDKEVAQERRMNGEGFPVPTQGSAGLTAIIRKACAYNPKDRYVDPTQMRLALEGLSKEETFEVEATVREERGPVDFIIAEEPDEGTVALSLVTEPKPKQEAESGIIPEVTQKSSQVSEPKWTQEQPIDESLLEAAREELRRKQRECAEAGVSKKNQLVAVILALFFNLCGAPYFYMGYPVKGLIRLGITFISMPLGVIPVVIGVMIEGWIYAFRIGTGEAKDKAGRYVLSASQKKAWAPKEK